MDNLIQMLQGLMQGQGAEQAPAMEAPVDLSGQMDKGLQEDEFKTKIANLEKQLGISREDYRNERMDERYHNKGKLSKIGNGITEFLTGLGGVSSPMKEYEKKVNSDFETDRKSQHELMQLYKMEQMGADKDREFGIKEKAVDLRKLLGQNQLTFNKEKEEAANKFKAENLKLKTGIATQNSVNSSFDNLLKYYKAQAIAEGKPAKNEVELLQKMLEDKQIDQGEYLKQAQRLITAKGTKSTGTGKTNQPRYTVKTQGGQPPVVTQYGTGMAPNVSTTVDNTPPGMRPAGK